MTGTEILALASSILGDETVDETFGLQMLNVLRGVYEGKRPWQVLKKVNSTVTITGANTYTNPLAVPSDLRYYIGDGSIQLFDGTNIPDVCTEFPFEEQLMRKNNSFEFCVDYGASLFYIMGVVPKNYTVYQWYISDPGDIEADTEWLKFPARFHPILAYELAAMWRLGTDYDDVAARNADDNARRADMLFKGMEQWDTKLALSAVKNVEYPQHMSGKNVGDRNGPRGTRRY